MEDCFSLQDFLQALCFETWDATSNEKLESLMEANGFPVHCGLPCGATLCALAMRTGPTSKQLNCRNDSCFGPGGGSF